MMGAVALWLRQVMATAFFAAALMALVPSGAVKRLATLCCTLLFLLALFRPFLGNGEKRLEDSFAAMEAMILAETESLQWENQELGAVLIEEELVSYIEATAAEEGISCTARVTLSPDENGVPLPVSVDLTSKSCDDGFRKRLAVELGVAMEQIRWEAE